MILACSNFCELATSLAEQANEYELRKKTKELTTHITRQFTKTVKMKLTYWYTKSTPVSVHAGTIDHASITTYSNVDSE
jgi:2'-5' RNA ligase